MKFSKLRNLLAVASMAVMGIFVMLAAPSTAQAQTIQCFGYTATGGAVYPADGTHAFYCGPDASNVPSVARRNTLYNAIDSALASKTNVRNKMSGQNVLFYFFRNRTEANSYLGSHYSMAYTTGTARCGNTFWNSGINTVAVAIYDECTLATGQWTNPSVDRTGLHETGHGFALAYARAGSVAPDRTSGFSSLFTATDKPSLTPSNWSSYTTAQKNTYICGMFGTQSEGLLEIDLGSSTTNTGPVCTGSTPNSPYDTHTPSQIANNDKKVPPYFIANGAYVETFAEEFVVYLVGKFSAPTFLPITDFFLGESTPPTVGGVTPPRAMNCTRYVVETYVDTGARPTDPQLMAHGCPAQTQL